MKNLSIVVLLIIGCIAYRQQASANDVAFTSCLVPTGTIIANYNEGEHGIAGLGLKSGMDTVYQLPNNNAMQCFCGSDGKGIQTDWLRVSTITPDQQKVYENQGWFYIPSGAAWGLLDEPYMAYNKDYMCSSSSGGSIPSGDGKSDGKSDGLGSLVQAARGNNLASTGNLEFIAIVFGTGLAMIVAGLLMRKYSN